MVSPKWPTVKSTVYLLFLKGIPLRYRHLSRYLKEHFGTSVSKIILDAGLTCPNRDGTLSTDGCLYCDPFGSGSGAAAKGLSIPEQLAAFAERTDATMRKYIAYFQAFTNTYAPVAQLKTWWDQAVSQEGVVVLAVGTRPDCLPDDILDLLASYQPQRDVWLEIGLQSAVERTLRLINRGHTLNDFVDAVHRARARGLTIIAHAIIGLPGEGEDEIRYTARLLRDLDIDGLKLHSLYVTKGTGMADMVACGQYHYISQEEFVRQAVIFLENVPSRVVIHRLTGDPIPARMLGPDWTLEKGRTLELIRRRLQELDTWQGKECPA